jgi:hypothetical protein
MGTLKKTPAGTRQSKSANEEREVWVRYMDWLAQNNAVKLLRGELLHKMLLPAGGRTLHSIS